MLWLYPRKDTFPISLVSNKKVETQKKTKTTNKKPYISNSHNLSIIQINYKKTHFKTNTYKYYSTGTMYF